MSSNHIPCKFNPLGASAWVTIVEYLETTGTQYIDTGIPTNMIAYAEIEHYHIAFTSYSACGWGAADTYVSSATNGIKYATGKANYWWSLRGAEQGYAIVGRLRTVVDAVLDSMQTFDSNGTRRINLAGGGAPPITTRKFWLFRANCTSTSSYDGTLRIYRAFFRLTDGTEIDLLPALANGEPCMVDLKSGKIYRNAGTGKFNTPM